VQWVDLVVDDPEEPVDLAALGVDTPDAPVEGH
jgi:hypothetical protein